MHAVDDLSDAIDATREFLTPLRLGFLLKLALIVFFVSSLGFSGPGFPMGDVGMLTDDPTQTGEWDEFQAEYEAETGEEFPMDELLASLVIIGLVFAGIWLVYTLIKSILDFVFVESLRSEAVHFRRYFVENLGRGFRLFLFRIGVVVATSLLVGGPLYYLATTGGGLDQAAGSTLGALVVLGFAVTLLYSIVLRFTTEFVVPIMLLEDRGVLSAWSRFWATFRSNWSEYVVYLLLAWIILLVITITAWFVIGITAFVLAIPFTILLFVVGAMLAELGVLGGILFVLVLLFGVVLFLLLLSMVWTPIVAYFQYYALLLLGDTDDELDLIPDQRAAIRGHASTTAAGAAVADSGTEPDSSWDYEDGTVTGDRDEDDFGDAEDDTDAETSDDESGGESWSETVESAEFEGEDEFEWYGSDDSGSDAGDETDERDSGADPDADTGASDDTEADSSEETESAAGDETVPDALEDDADDEADDDLDDRGW